MSLCGAMWESFNRLEQMRFGVHLTNDGFSLLKLRSVEKRLSTYDITNERTNPTSLLLQPEVSQSPIPKVAASISVPGKTEQLYGSGANPPLNARRERESGFCGSVFGRRLWRDVSCCLRGGSETNSVIAWVT